MRLALILLLLAIPARAKEPAEQTCIPKWRYDNLLEKSLTLAETERICLHVVLKNWEEQVIAKYRTPITDTATQVETCAALSATLSPDRTSITTYCAACEAMP